MSERHLHPLTSEIVASIAEIQRRMCETHNELEDVIAAARDTIAQSRDLLLRTDKILTGQ